MIWAFLPYEQETMWKEILWFKFGKKFKETDKSKGDHDGKINKYNNLLAY